MDPTNVMTLYAGTDHPFDGSNPQRVYKSNDGGATWQVMGLDPGGLSIDVLAVDPDDSSRVAAVSRGVNGFFQSTNGGVSWTAVSLATGSGCGAVRTILYEPPGDGILLGVTQRRLSVRRRRRDVDASRRGAERVGRRSSLRRRGSRPSCTAAASPAFPGGTGGVFRSSDGGATWTPIGTGLSTSSVQSLALDASETRFMPGSSGVASRCSTSASRLGMPEPPAPPDRETRVIERP